MALCGVLGGCVYTPEVAPPPAVEPSVSPPQVITVTNGGDGELGRYVSLKRQAADSDETQWRVLYDDAKANPGISARERRLRLALLLGAPNRPEPDRKEAERLLEALLSDDGGGGSLSASMKDLLVVSKHEIVKRGRLVERMKQLEARQDELETDVNRLEEELAEAIKKIQALTKIEKSIERPKNSEAP